jgi:hypothetical protein
MELNEIGDFLAGVFGPLAILWLVLGFFQQGIELRQSSEALKLQAEELRNSVQQQILMVITAREQLEAEKKSFEVQEEKNKQQLAEAKRRAQPNFVFSAGGSHSERSLHQIVLKNYGAKCRKVSISALERDWSFSPSVYEFVDSDGGQAKFTLDLPRCMDEDHFVLKVKFIDDFREENEFLFSGTLLNSGNSYLSMKIG